MRENNADNLAGGQVRGERLDGLAVRLRIAQSNITGVLLAGGRAQRMGGQDKGLLAFQGRPLAAYTLAALAQVAGAVCINANRNLDGYARFGYPLVPDLNDRFDGPLAGVLSAMRAVQTDYLLTAPCDTPFIHADLLHRLVRHLSASGATVCTAHDGERLQPLFMLVERQLADSLAEYLVQGQRKAGTWLALHGGQRVDCSDHPEWFTNINTPTELQIR